MDAENRQRLDEILHRADREGALYEMVEFYVGGDEETRQQVRGEWDYGCEWKYPDQRRLACTIGERYAPLARIRASLLSYSIASKMPTDPRDVIVALAAIYHSMRIAGIEKSAVVNEVLRVSDDGFRRLLEDFDGRPEEKGSLKAFLLGERPNAQGETELVFSWEE